MKTLTSYLCFSICLVVMMGACSKKDLSTGSAVPVTPAANPWVQLTYGIGGNRTWQRVWTFVANPSLPDSVEILGTVTAAITVVSDSIISLPFSELSTEGSGLDYYLISADSNILQYAAYDEFDLGYEDLNQIETVLYFPKKDSIDITFTYYGNNFPASKHYYTP